MPSKLRIALGELGAPRVRVKWLFWIMGSALSLWRYGTLGFSLASCCCFKSAAVHAGIWRIGGETSLRYEAPTWGLVEPSFWFRPCADADAPENRPNPNSARRTPAEQRTKPNRTRGLKKANSEADFPFIVSLDRSRTVRRRNSREYSR